MADIVISHTTEDRDRAEVIARSLSAQGLKVWMYRDILGQGGDRDEVTAKVRNATRVIALWSPAGCASQWVLEEAKAAARDHRLINVELQPGMTPRAFQSGLRIDLSGWSGQRSDPALTPFSEAIATIVTGRTRVAASERPKKKSLFGFTKEAGAERSEPKPENNIKRDASAPNMFDKPDEPVREKPVKANAPVALPPIPAAKAPRPVGAVPKLVVPAPIGLAPVVAAPIAPKPADPKQVVAEQVAAEQIKAAPPEPVSAPEIQVFETSKPRTKPAADEHDNHISLGRAFGYGLVASVAAGLLFLAGRHYFNTQPMTVAATQATAPAAAAPEIVDGFRADGGKVKFVSEIDTQGASATSAQFGSDEWLFAIGDTNGAARSYVASTGKFFQSWRANGKAVTDVGFDSQADLLALSSVDGWVYVWRLANGSLQRIEIGKSPVRALAWRPDTTFIATGSDDGLLEIRAISGSSEPVRHRFHNAVTSVAWRQDGAILAAGLKSGGIAFIDPKTGGVKFSATGHTGAVHALAFSPDGDILGSVGEDGAAKLWNAYDGAAAGELSLTPCTPEQMTKDGKCPALDVMFSPDSSLVAVSGQNAVVEAFSVKTKKRLFVLRGHKAPVTSISWSYYDHRIVTADSAGKATFWNSPADSK